jgi:hypothetical protein
VIRIPSETLGYFSFRSCTWTVVAEGAATTKTTTVRFRGRGNEVHDISKPLEKGTTPEDPLTKIGQVDGDFSQ